MYKKANKLQDLIGKIFYQYPSVEPGPKAITRGGRILSVSDLDKLEANTRSFSIPDDTPLKMPDASYRHPLRPGSSALVRDGKIMDKPQLNVLIRQLRARAWAKDVIHKIQDAKGYFGSLKIK